MMNPRLALLVPTFLVCGWIAAPSGLPVQTASPDAAAIVARAVQATKKLRSIKYTLESTISGSRINATVFCQRANVPQPGPMEGIYSVKGEISQTGKPPERFGYSYDGKTFRFRARGSQNVEVLESPALAEIATTLSMEEALCTIDPFVFPESVGPRLKFVRAATIAGRECDLVEITREVPDKSGGTLTIVSKWGIDRASNLPIYFESSTGTQKTMHRIEIDPPLDPAVFRLTGAEVKVEKSDAIARGLLPVGAPAPDFRVKDGAGRDVRLADYRGKLLLIDFWGTWCAPCIQAMPHLKKVHDRYGKRGLAMVGMAVADAKGDPAGFMKARGYRWTCVPKGDSVAKTYRVSVFPTLYLVGRDGKILFRATGSHDVTQRALEAALRKHLG